MSHKRLAISVCLIFFSFGHILGTQLGDGMHPANSGFGWQPMAIDKPLPDDTRLVRFSQQNPNEPLTDDDQDPNPVIPKFVTKNILERWKPDYHLKSAVKSKENVIESRLHKIKLPSTISEVNPTYMTLTFPMRDVDSSACATLTVLDLYPITRAPFSVSCRARYRPDGQDSDDEDARLQGQLSATDASLDPKTQPKIYSADVTACLRAAAAAGLDEVKIELRLMCLEQTRSHCLFTETPFLVIQ